jgi:hypothetical protein
MKWGTNVGDVNLPACITLSSAGVTAEATSKAAAAWHSAAKVSTTASGGRAEARLGLSVFANVYESAHKVLVAERCNGVLRLLPSGIFHDSTALHPSKSQSTSILLTIKTSHQSITFDIPLGSSKTSAKRTSPAISALAQLLTRRDTLPYLGA